MRSFRGDFEKKLRRWLGGTGAATGMAAADSGVVGLATKFWFVALVVVVIATIVVPMVFGNTWPVQAIVAALWGVFVGGTFLFYFHKNLIITIVGTVLGASIAEFQNAVELVRQLTQVATQLTDLLNQVLDPPPQIYNASIFLFLLLAVVSCLPAYKES